MGCDLKGAVRLKSVSNARVRPVHILLLVLLVVVAYTQVTENGFISFDDVGYITGNSHVRAGLTLNGVLWAFTTARCANWHPLTWISHMLDWQLYGSNPTGHHLTNLLLHIANVLLLFALLNRMTGHPRRSLMVAALFAIHPLHVESVAWASERKDVLSALFGLLTITAYLGYVNRPKAGRYIAVIILFALGLMCKPMLVSLPILLLLLDYWPLRRTSALPQSGRDAVPMWRLILEKIPLLALVAASCVVTVWAQQTGGATRSLEACGVGIRLANAAVSMVGYIVKMLCPANLSFFYPHPMNTLPLWQVIGSSALVLGGFIAAIRCAKSRPYVTVGWLWYVVTLLPVIGLVQVGGQGKADRYAYIPLIGLYMAVVWAIAETAGATRGARIVLPVAACVVVLALAARTYVEVGYWRGSESLYNRAIVLNPNNQVAHYNLGEYFQTHKRFHEAEQHYREAVRLDPEDFEASVNLGNMLLANGKAAAAREVFLTLLRAHPASPRACEGVEMALVADGKKTEAIRFCLAAVKANPRIGRMYYNLGTAYADAGKLDEAAKEFAQAIRLDPRDASAHHNLGLAYQRQGRLEQAISEYREAIRLRPSDSRFHTTLANALFDSGDYAGAWAEVRATEQTGGEPAPEFVKALQKKMPEGK